MKAQAIENSNILNGVNVDDILGLIGQVADTPRKGAFQFRLRNSWLGGDLNRSQIDEFSALDGQVERRAVPFAVDSAEPILMAGKDQAPNPLEYVLHALAGDLTSTLVYHAAARGIAIEAIDSSLEGDLDMRGHFGLSEVVRKGFHAVRVRMTVQSDADVETLRELATFSSVFDIVSNSLPVDLAIEKV